MKEHRRAKQSERMPREPTADAAGRKIMQIAMLLLLGMSLLSGQALAGGSPPDPAGGGPGNGGGSNGGGGGSAGGGNTSGTYSILPLDLQIKAAGAATYRGVGVTGDIEPDADDTASQQWESGKVEPARFVIKVKNPAAQNPDVPASAYTIHARPRNEVAALYTFHLGTPGNAGADITNAIMSDAGYTLEEPFRPGTNVYITVTVVPVGRANGVRGIRIYWKSDSPSLSGFIPIALPTDRIPVAVKSGADNDYREGQHTITIYENPNKGGKKKGLPSGSSMGLINVGAYSCGTPEIVEAIENGFESAIVGADAEAIPMPVNPGFRKGPVSSALQTRAGDVVYVPVQSSVSGHGRNATYSVDGIAKCKIASANGNSSMNASLLNYWDDLQSDNLPTDGGGSMYDAIDLSVSVSGSPLQMGDWEEVN